MEPKNKQALKDVIFYFILIITVVFIIIGSQGCNPIRRVLKDPAKRSQMAAEIIKLGYCTNDTTIVEIHDTTVTIDTIDVPFIVVDTLRMNDTLVFWETKYFDIVKTKVVTKQVDRIVIDSAKVQVLEKELAETKGALADSEVRRKQWRNQFGAALSTLIFAIISIVVLIKYKK